MRPSYVKRCDRRGALLAAFPLVTFLTLIWTYVEDQLQEKNANQGYYTFWHVVPTQPMFIALPWLLASDQLTSLCFALFAYGIGRWGLEMKQMSAPSQSLRYQICSNKTKSHEG